MKIDVSPSITLIETEQAKEQVREQEQVPANDSPLQESNKTSFGIADLWNIRKNYRSARGRFRG